MTDLGVYGRDHYKHGFRTEAGDIVSVHRRNGVDFLRVNGETVPLTEIDRDALVKALGLMFPLEAPAWASETSSGV